MDIFNNIEIDVPLKCLVIRDFSDNLIRYDIVHSSMVQELINFINRLPIECFFQNFKLEIEKTGKRIYNEENLFTLDLKDFDIIRMVPTLYDPTSSKEHFETIKYILNEHPFLVGTEFFHLKDIVFKDYDKLIDTSKQIFEDLKTVPFPFYSYLMDDASTLKYLEEAVQNMDPEVVNQGDKEKEKEKEKEGNSKNPEKKEQTTKQNETTEKGKENINPNGKLEDPNQDPSKFLKSLLTSNVKKESKAKKPKSLEEIKQQILDMDYKRINLTNLPNSYIYETKNKQIKYRCLMAIYLSSFNFKIEANEAPKGDLLYIEVITLENNHYFITNNERGFFVNNCKQNIFDPTPMNNAYSFTLPGLLSLLSPSFKENFSKTLSQNINGDDFLVLPSPTDKFDWIVPVENPFSYCYRFRGFNSEKNEIIILNKEWNEEYQAIIDIKNAEELGLDAKEKLLVPFYNSFKEIAMKGAKLIAKKKLKPFSMSEAPNAGYYIYGNIFITVLEDSSDFQVTN